MSKQRQDPEGYRNDHDPRDIWEKFGDYAKVGGATGTIASVVAGALSRRSARKLAKMQGQTKQQVREAGRDAASLAAGAAFPLGAVGGAITLGRAAQLGEGRQARYEKLMKRRK